MFSMIRSYLRMRIGQFAFCALCAFLLIACAMAFGTPLASLHYGLFLCALILFVFLLCDFCRFRSRILSLQLVDAQGDALFLPKPRDMLDKCYAELCQALLDRALEEHSCAGNAQSELISYYTLWLHQIKTPISAMHLLLDAGETDAAALKRQLFSIERYTSMALEYARLSHVENDLVIARMPVMPLIKKCVRRYADLFISKHLSLTLDPIPFCVHTDEKWLSFILEQLLSNAVKYTAEGGVHIYAEKNEIVIEDTGAGIRPEDLPRVFDFGYTGLNGRLDKRASGIGLFMARRAGQLISAHITLESTLGKGTRARVRLPSDAPLSLE